ncbi:transposable element Tcb1 transposase [Trichonephila clavipes]|nr:transposable element Tcb1 transposase [Trichonephila clavipes]
MEAGWSAKRIARQLGGSDCVMRRCWDQWKREMSFAQRPGSGHPRQNSRREDRHIVRNARVQPTASSAAIQAQRHTAPTAGVMVWGVIAYNIRSPLVLIRGTMTAQRYVHDILQPHGCHGSQEPFLNKTMLSLTRQGCHKTVSVLLLPFLALPDL